MIGAASALIGVSGPRAVGTRFAPRPLPAEDAAAFVREGLRRLRSGQRIEALVHAPAAEVRGRIGRWADVGDAGPEHPGRCVVAMDAEWMDWAAMALGTLEAPFRVIGPPQFADYVRRWGERFRAAAQDLPVKA